MDYRILRNWYDNAWALDNIWTVIQNVHNQINTNYPYPINLNIVWWTWVSSFAHPAWTTYLQFMQDTANLWTIWYEFWSSWFDLFFGVDIWNSLQWEFKYNQFNIASSNIVDWKSRISWDDISNYFVINDWTGPIFKDDVTSIATNWIFEKWIFEPQKDKALQPDLISLPKIYINPETEDWYSINPGDKKKVQIYTSKDWLNLDYVSKIQSISVKWNGWKLDVAIEVADKSRAYLVRPTIPNILKNYLTRIRKIEVNQ